ncbi:uncharacterized protein LOC131891613 [Tigriopus californicus]|uniref:uncharacterized protein LOC131891613 n=1 Tax=Tigriopus californicus TaxID=6832 RepID=UPI0027DA9D9E|nr:uncharacterized protein LOC131891613 [Tigriopus californicus]
MIATTCLLVILLILNHGQSGNSHVVTFRQATDSFKIDSKSFSVGEINDRLEFDERSGIMETMINVPQCPGRGNKYFPITVQNPSGCYVFQTTGFNMNGYPNRGGSFFRSSYFCGYMIEFGATVSGTVTVKEKDFQFQEPNSSGRCDDFLLISGVSDQQQENDNSDSDDRDMRYDVVQYCGTITGDKIRDFSNSELFIELSADDTENGNGAEIVICID